MRSKTIVLTSGKKITFKRVLNESVDFPFIKVSYSCDQPFISKSGKDPQVTTKEVVEIQKAGRKYIVERTGIESLNLLSLNLPLSSSEKLCFMGYIIDSYGVVLSFTFGKIEPILRDSNDIVTVIVDCSFNDYGVNIEEGSGLWILLEDRLNLHLRSKGYQEEYSLAKIGKSHFYLDIVRVKK
jgi:hypothetical protein